MIQALAVLSQYTRVTDDKQHNLIIAERSRGEKLTQ